LVISSLMLPLRTRSFRAFIVFFCCYRAHRALHSFPTRRSSDLSTRCRARSGPTACSAWCSQGEATAHGAAWRGDVTAPRGRQPRSEEHTSELQSRFDLVCRLLLEKKKKKRQQKTRNA